MTETASDLINHLMIDNQPFAYIDLHKLLSAPR